MYSTQNLVIFTSLINCKASQIYSILLHSITYIMQLENLKSSIVKILEETNAIDDKLQAICDYLEAQIPYYDWVGFYFKNGDKNELKLAQYTGEPTEHTIIPFLSLIHI